MMSNFKKKILFVGNVPVTFKVFFEDFIKLLNKKINFDILTNTQSLNKKNIISDVKYYHVPIKREIGILSDFYCLLKIIKFLKTKKYDLIISITPKAGLLSSIASYLTFSKNKVHIFTGQVWSNKKFIYKNLLIFFDKVICYCSDFLVCDSKAQRKYLYKNNLTKKKIEVIGHGSICGVDTKKFNSIRNKKKIRKSLNLNKDHLLLIYVGRINYDKGIHLLLKTFENIYKRYDDLRLIIVGQDEIDLKNLLNKKYFKIYDRIKVFPFTNNVHQYLKASDIFVFPSYREGFGLSVIEALSCGLPVIVSDTYGLKDSFIDKLNGLRFKTGSVNSFKNRLIKMVENKKLRLKYSNNARKFVIKKFSRKKVLNLYKNYFLKMI